MIHLCEGIVIYALLRFIFYKNPELFLCLLILICWNFFDLLPFVNHKIVAVPIILLFIIELGFSRRLKLGPFGLIVISYLSLLLIGIITPFFNGQPLLLGIKAIKFHFIILVYFIVVSHDIQINKFSKYFVLLSLIYVALLDLDLFILHGKIFSQAIEQYSGERAGFVRYTHSGHIVVISCVISFIRLVKERSITNMICYIVLFCQLLFVSLTRSAILATIISCLVMLFLLRKKLDFRTIVIMYSMVFAAVPILFLYGHTLTDRYLIRQTIEEKVYSQSSMNLRLKSLAVSPRVLGKRPFLGRGYENEIWKEKDPEGVLIHDSGIVKFFYQNGLLGFLWFVIMAFGVVRMTWPLCSKYPELYGYFLPAFLQVFLVDYFFHPKLIIFLGIYLGLTGRLWIQYNTFEDDQTVSDSDNSRICKKEHF